ncbi:hypothetical protein Aph01nite_14500 [Acrocarpospora phusangensis]|uniref:TIR domain-containing protein n=1 Tax=Acrocarpospora phusangensis TaxID=1070424 RepID=A0A919QAJ7_9ACTN|nr:TIR-like protein FxsC [Acrocarpospora phusangensis]GIH23140.1 hypothetical protein Aph01nite_14500 [Acrocarpospora phusangensis]
MAGSHTSHTHPPYFFLSYAHTPPSRDNGVNPDRDVATFFEDLCQEILHHTEFPAGIPVGFMDTGLRNGDAWQERLAMQLAICRVFVPLYSRRYFSSEYCGKEWAAFDLRRRASGADDRPPPEAIVPAFWVPVPDFELPEAVRHIQFKDEALGWQYLKYGIRGLMRINRLRDEYHLTVDALAKRVINLAEEVRLPSREPCDLAAIKSPFQPDIFRITVVAPDARTLPTGRNRVFYGPAATDWHPYRAISSRSLADSAAEVVRSFQFKPDVGSLNDHRGDLLADEASPCPAVVIVDPWATLDARCHEFLKALDRRNKAWVGVMVVWNDDDEQLLEAGEELRRGLGSAFPVKTHQGRLSAKDVLHGISGLAQFESVLRQVIQALRASYIREAPAFPPKVPGSPRPHLLAPACPTDPAEPREA